MSLLRLFECQDNDQRLFLETQKGYLFCVFRQERAENPFFIYLILRDLLKAVLQRAIRNHSIQCY